MVISDHLPILQVIVPLVTAPLCAVIFVGRYAWGVATSASWLTFYISTLLYERVRQEGTLSYALGGWEAPWGIEYRIDAANALVLLVVSLVGAVVLTYSRASVDKEVSAPRTSLYYTTYVLCLTGLLGMAATGDAFNVFVFLEISSLSSYALIALGPNPRALLAAYRYLMMGTIGATFILIGIGLMYMMTGTLNMVDLSERLPEVSHTRTIKASFAFLTVGLFLKVAVWPLHHWLPNAYTHAPSAATAFLAGTATKVALYLLVRFFFAIYGISFSFHFMRLDYFLLPLSLLAVFFASLNACYRVDVSRVLAYSSIAQIGYMTMGISLHSEAGLTAALLHLFNHALIKSSLFLAIGCVVYRIGSGKLVDIKGIGRVMPWTMAAFVVGGLSLIGVPLTSGFISKWHFITAALERDMWPVAALLLVTSFLAVIYIGRIVEAAYFHPPAERFRYTEEAPLSMLVPLWALALANLYFGINPAFSIEAARNAAALLTGGGAVNPQEIPVFCLLIPALASLGIWMNGRMPNLREAVTLISAFLLFSLVLMLTPNVMTGKQTAYVLIELFPGLPVVLSVEPLGFIFALVASSLWILTSFYTIGYMRGNSAAHQTRFYMCFALSITATMGIAFAGNLLTLFIFYELLTLSTFPLVTHNGNEKAMRAGRVYLGILLSTSICFFLFAILWTWHLTGTLDFLPGGILQGKISAGLVPILLGLFVFGIGKAAVMPFHRWLPAAMVAPTPVSALLHAVAVVKAGVFCILKVTVYIFGLDLLRETGAHQWFMWAAAFTILTASLIALTKDNLKARLAYSTISQLSYIVLGAMLATGMGILGGTMHVVMHAFGKITLFFCAGAIYTAARKTEISEMDGLGRIMPVTFGAFLIGALSIIGLPPLGGSWSKWYLLRGAADTGEFLMIAVLLISSLLNIAYLLPIPARAFFRPRPGHAPAPMPEGHEVSGISRTHIKEAPLFCVVPLCLSATACIVLFFVMPLLFEVLQLIPAE